MAKRKISKEARKQGAISRMQTGTFNRYLRALSPGLGKRTEAQKATLAEAEATIERGTATRKTPIWEDGKRVGMMEKEMPLLPSQHAILLSKIRTLRDKIHNPKASAAAAAMRDAFIEMLPKYAKRKGLDGLVLYRCGVPIEDIKEAGIELPSQLR